jgi:hypothetical protein
VFVGKLCFELAERVERRASGEEALIQGATLSVGFLHL